MSHFIRLSYQWMRQTQDFGPHERLGSNISNRQKKHVTAALFCNCTLRPFFGILVFSFISAEQRFLKANFLEILVSDLQNKSYAPAVFTSNIKAESLDGEKISNKVPFCL